MKNVRKRTIYTSDTEKRIAEIEANLKTIDKFGYHQLQALGRVVTMYEISGHLSWLIAASRTEAVWLAEQLKRALKLLQDCHDQNYDHIEYVGNDKQTESEIAEMATAYALRKFLREEQP